MDSLLVMSSTLKRRSVRTDWACMRMMSTSDEPARSACTSDATKKVIEFTWARSASPSRASERLE